MKTSSWSGRIELRLREILLSRALDRWYRKNAAYPLESDRYGAVAIALHWLAAVLIVAAFIVGVYMVDLHMSPSRLKLFSYHKWMGVTVLALSAIRLAWRLTHKPPQGEKTARWQRFAAHATHGLLYVLFFAVPLVGWALTSASGFPVVVFGVLPLPDFVHVDKALAEMLKPWHQGLAYVLGALVIVHVLAAVMHRHIDGHPVLHRMGLRLR